jgi:opacity protein-like surface antigen
MIASRVSALLGAALAAAFLTGASSAGFAADLGYSIKDAPPPAPSGRVWYLKGTIGAGNNEVGSMWNEAYASGDFTVGHKDMKSSPFYGIGIGVEHNRWLRFDITGEYRGKYLFIGNDRYNNGGACPGSGCGSNSFTADIESWVGLANAYIDLGTWRGLTPYVGGGIGIASVSVLGLEDVNVPQNGWAYGADHTETNFAWALYAGVSYDVTSQFTVDLGYRYLDMGDAKSGPVTTYLGDEAYSGHELRDLTAHDLLLTARWRLDQPVASYMPIK